MNTMPLVDSVRSTLETTKEHLRADTPARVREELDHLLQLLAKPQWLRSKDAADLLGVASATTVKNWLEGAYASRQRFGQPRSPRSG